jgi:hypothetical protein
MKTYIGTKIIKAQPMTRAYYNALRGWTVPADENGEDEGYLVEYTDGGKPNHPLHDGYISWSPKEQFEGAYRADSGLSFGLALEMLKSGSKVARAGWNVKGNWIEYHTPYPFGQIPRPVPYIRMIYSECKSYPMGAIFPWVAQQRDMLADDWMVIA